MEVISQLCSTVQVKTNLAAMASNILELATKLEPKLKRRLSPKGRGKIRAMSKTSARIIC